MNDIDTVKRLIINEIRNNLEKYSEYFDKAMAFDIILENTHYYGVDGRYEIGPTNMSYHYGAYIHKCYDKQSNFISYHSELNLRYIFG